MGNVDLQQPCWRHSEEADVAGMERATREGQQVWSSYWEPGRVEPWNHRGLSFWFWVTQESIGRFWTERWCVQTFILAGSFWQLWANLLKRYKCKNEPLRRIFNNTGSALAVVVAREVACKCKKWSRSWKYFEDRIGRTCERSEWGLRELRSSLWFLVWASKVMELSLLSGEDYGKGRFWGAMSGTCFHFVWGA